MANYKVQPFLSSARNFLTDRIIGILALSSMLGLFAASVELLLAASTQFFLSDIGLISPESVRPPEWLPDALIPQNSTFPILIALVIARGIAASLQPFLQGLMVENFREINRSRILDWCFFYRGIRSGYLQALFSEVVNGASLMMRVVQYSFVQIIYISILLVNLFAISWTVTGALILALSILALPIRHAASRLKKYGGRMVRDWETTQETLSNSMKNLLILRIYGTAEKECLKAKQTVKRFRNTYLRYYAVSAVMSNFPLAAGTILILSALYFISGDYRLLSGAQLLAYFYLFIRLVQSGALLVNAVSDISFYSAQFFELFGWWKANSDYSASLNGAVDRETEPEHELKMDTIGWELSKVSFDHNRHSNAPLIKDLSIQLDPGKCLAIVGPSGSGKSTILGLMLGEHTQTSGSLNVIGPNGTRINLVKVKRTLKENLGYVGPENFLIDGTIRDNLQYGLRTPANDEQITKCLQMASCDFVWQLPKCLDHRLTEQGEGLSAGQKQRLSIARALLRNPKALILDEATANLDSRTEEEIIKTLEGLKQRLTLVIVSHREPILRLADQIIRLG